MSPGTLVISALPEPRFRACAERLLDGLDVPAERVTWLLPSVYQQEHGLAGESIRWPAARYSAGLAPRVLRGRRFGEVAVLYPSNALRHRNVFALARRAAEGRLVAVEADSQRWVSTASPLREQLGFAARSLRAALRDGRPRAAFAALWLACLPARAARAARRARRASEATPCPLCRTRDAAFHYAFDARVAIRRCRACALFFPDPGPTPEALHERYRGYGSYGDPEVLRRSYAETAVPRYPELARAARLGVPLRVLEIGCGNGAFVHNLKRRFPHWEVVGQEVDPVNAELARRHAGVPILVGRLPELALPASGFDFALASQVLEHVPPNEVGDSVAALARALAPGGAFLGDVPNFASPAHRWLAGRWKNVAPEEHVSMWTPASLRRLLERAGFTRVEVRSSRSQNAAGLWLDALGRRPAAPEALRDWWVRVPEGRGADLFFSARRG